MQSESIPQPLPKAKPRYLKPLLILLCLGLVVLGTGTAIVLTTQMDIPTFVASLSTPQITASDLQQGKVKPVILIDVRTPEEYQEDHIANSILVPNEDIQADFGIKQIYAIVEAAKSNPVKPTLVLYCHSGARSVKAYKRLESAGLKPKLEIVVLSGGITRWRKTVAKQQDAQLLKPILLPVRSPF